MHMKEINIVLITET